MKVNKQPNEFNRKSFMCVCVYAYPISGRRQ